MESSEAISGLPELSFRQPCSHFEMQGPIRQDIQDMIFQFYGILDNLVKIDRTNPYVKIYKILDRNRSHTLTFRCLHVMQAPDLP